MKVLSEGVPPNSWPREATCNTCHTVVELDTGDIKFSDNQRDPFAEWLCPVCGMKSSLHTSIISDIYREEQRRRNLSHGGRTDK